MKKIKILFCEDREGKLIGDQNELMTSWSLYFKELLNEEWQELEGDQKIERDDGTETEKLNPKETEEIEKYKRKEIRRYYKYVKK